MTVFDPRSRRVVARAGQFGATPEAYTAVRSGDFESAPYMWAEGGPKDAGRVEATAEPLSPDVDPALRPIQLMEDVYVVLPRGVAARPGDRLLLFRLGETFIGRGQVVVPTGVVRVVSALDGNRARATVVQKYEQVYVNNGVVPLERLEMPAGVSPSHVEFGAATRVRWVYASPELPATRTPLILDATSAQGLVPGDQVTIRGPEGSAGRAAGTPDGSLGVAQVVRVTRWGASAMLLEVSGGGITAGAPAVVSAKMP